MLFLIFPFSHFFFFFEKDTPSITDWIQAITSILIVLGTFSTVYKLFKKDSQRDNQIEKIGNLFEESKKQTEQFEQQTQIMREMLELNRQQSNILLDGVKLNNPYSDEYFENEKKIRKLELMPRFSFNGSISIGSNNTIQLTLINNGKTARFLDMIVFGPKSISWNIERLKDTIIEQNATLILSGQLIDFSNVISAINFDFDLIYLDSIGTKYKQKVIRTDNGYNYKFALPVEIQ